MNLKDILAISGHSGLFRFVSQSRNGFIVEQLSDNKRIFAPASAKISGLEDIAIFTDRGEIPLKTVLRTIYQKEEGGQAPSPKSTDQELKAYFAGILPDYDRNRMYVSDIRKVMLWYQLLTALNMIDLEEEAAESAPDTES